MKFLRNLIASLRSNAGTDVSVEAGFVRAESSRTGLPNCKPEIFVISDESDNGGKVAKQSSRRPSYNQVAPESQVAVTAINGEIVKQEGDTKENKEDVEVVEAEQVQCFSCIPAMTDALKRLHQMDNGDNEEEGIVIENGVDDSDVAFHQMFEALDRDASGSIDIFELKKMVQGLGLPHGKSDLQRMFNRIDRDGDGNISFEDFKEDLLSRWGTPEERRHLLVELFKMFDVTGDGHMQAKEVKVVMMSIGEKVSNQEIDEMIRQFNKDKHNMSSIVLDDFVAAMEKHIDSILPKSASSLPVTSFSISDDGENAASPDNKKNKKNKNKKR